MSSSNAPPAEGKRVDWSDLPAHMRDAIEERLGGRVVEAVTQRGGFSPGLAARLRTAYGTRHFVKAVSEQANPDSPGMHRREAEVVSALPIEAAVPRLEWSYDQGGWVALCFEDVDGKMPTIPWHRDELDLVTKALIRLHEVLTPTPISSTPAGHAFAKHIKGFDELRETKASAIPPWVARNIDQLVELESEAPAMVSGTTLLNFDVRADNILIADGRVYFVDWPHACGSAVRRLGRICAVGGDAGRAETHRSHAQSAARRGRQARNRWRGRRPCRLLSGGFVAPSATRHPDSPSIPGRAGRDRGGVAARKNGLALTS